MTEELDLVTHVLLWRDDEKWRIVPKDQLEEEREGLIAEDEDDWSDARSGHRGRGDHYVYGFISGGVPERVQVNDDENVPVQVLGSLWAVVSPERISMFSMVVPGRQSRQRLPKDRDPWVHFESWPAATRTNSPDTPIGRILAVVLDDLEATAPGLLRFGQLRLGSRSRPGLIVLADSTRSATGIFPEWADEGVDALILVADAVQELVIEALWGERMTPAWPSCAGHPHPLTAALVDGQPTWSCPSNGHVVARIGELVR